MRISRVKEPFKHLNGEPYKAITVKQRSYKSDRETFLNIDNIVNFPIPTDVNKTHYKK